jgi:hypothetical protein
MQLKIIFLIWKKALNHRLYAIFFGGIGNGEKELELQKLNELLLHFCHQYMKIINETILTLQMKSISAVHLYDVMFKLLIKLKNRLEVKYFSSKISEILKNTNNKIKKKFEEEALFAYERTIDYLEKWFDFKDSIFKTFTELNLENLIFIVNSLGINANTDDLFEFHFRRQNAR